MFINLITLLPYARIHLSMNSLRNRLLARYTSPQLCVYIDILLISAG
nr:MAG TPA: hypothetical protein [Caudoviricetes sp.]DAY76757.1 MAG TPA: hypothetical protein [Caudoviricetes sp.]